MHRPRIIPVLLLKERGLVKSLKFKGHRYIGDPLNAARIFNELQADELIFLDIDASRKGRTIPLEFAGAVAEEVMMPFAVGGGIGSLDEIRQLITAGAERVVIGTKAAIEPEFVRRAADEFGSSTIAVCIDVKKDLLGRYRVRVRNGSQATGFDPVAFAELLEANGAGEIIIQSIDRDGTMEGYDLNLIERVARAVSIPVVALGGAGVEAHLVEAFEKSFANGVAAGSMFVYQSKNRGVLINYPENKNFF